MNKSKTELQILNKYWVALKKLKGTVEQNRKASLSQFMLRNELEGHLAIVLKEMGILANNNKRGKHAEWFWIGKEPSRQMAEDVIKSLTQRRSDYYHNFEKDDLVDEVSELQNIDTVDFIRQNNLNFNLGSVVNLITESSGNTTELKKAIEFLKREINYLNNQ